MGRTVKFGLPTWGAFGRLHMVQPDRCAQKRYYRLPSDDILPTPADKDLYELTRVTMAAGTGRPSTWTRWRVNSLRSRTTCTRTSLSGAESAPGRPPSTPAMVRGTPLRFPSFSKPTRACFGYPVRPRERGRPRGPPESHDVVPCALRSHRKPPPSAGGS